MKATVSRKQAKPTKTDAGKTPSRSDKGWDERLRLVGDARFVEVEWSGRDHPSWPLPTK